MFEKATSVITKGALATGCIAAGIMSACAGYQYISIGIDIATDLIADYINGKEED